MERNGCRPVILQERVFLDHFVDWPAPFRKLNIGTFVAPGIDRKGMHLLTAIVAEQSPVAEQPGASGNPHALNPEEVARSLGVSPAIGLSTSDVSARSARFGSNIIRTMRPRRAWRIFIDQFGSIVVALLAVAAAVAWVTSDRCSRRKQTGC